MVRSAAGASRTRKSQTSQNVFALSSDGHISKRHTPECVLRRTHLAGRRSTRYLSLNALRDLMMSLSPAEQLLYSTVRLVSSKYGKPLSTGTGFFYQFQLEDDRICPCLITNKHVMKDADEVSALCHNEDIKNPGNPTDTTAAMRFIIASSKIFYHPSADVDLCAIPLAQIMTQARDAGRPLFLVILDKSLIPKDDEWEDFDAIEEITMIGCPNGLFDEINSLPLIRRGITASTLTKNFNGKNEFMVRYGLLSRIVWITSVYL